jgi:hypothetical protein
MRIESTTHRVKSIRGHVAGYVANFQDIQTYPTRETKPEALQDLAKLVEFRCTYESTNVKVMTVCGHVGIFTYGLSGTVDIRHVWPDGHVSHMGGTGSFDAEENSFRHHVAQLTWDGTLATPEFLPACLHREFRSWCEFQLRYKYAQDVLQLAHDEAHRYACDSTKPWEAQTAA